MLCLLHIVAIPAYAQSNAERAAEQLRRQEQRERAVSDQLNNARPDVRLPRATAVVPAPADQSDTPCFPISRLKLVGDSAARFAWALRSADGLLSACIGSHGVNAIIGALQNTLISAGYVTTRVVAAPQDLRNGELTLTVVPGRIRAIRFVVPKDGSRQWLGPTYSSSLPTSPGNILNLRDIEQALENFKRVPTAEADIQIAPGDQPGQSDLMIQWHESLPLRLSLSMDDSGSKATGKYQGNATLFIDNPFGINDLFYVNVSHDLQAHGNGRGTHNLAVSYSLPIGYWELAATASKYRYYQSVAGANQSYVYGGTSSNADLKLTRVVYRDTSRKISASIDGYQRINRNFIDDTEVEVQHRRMGGFVYTLADKEFIGDATLEGTLSYKQGTGAFGSMAAPEELFGEGTARPRIVNADIELSLPFTVESSHFQYQGSWRAQWNRTPLILQDQFSIGGRYTVRGFDGESGLLAERGQLLRNDIGWNIGNTGQQPYAGIDYAYVNGPGAAQLIGTHLAGAVIGLRGQYQRLQYDFFVGIPLSRPAGFETAAVTGGFSLSYGL
ncbi:MAG TPA: ShlB/FhaC/HecB family hemolysin secretion/activation protein [Herbaspirillum sp.]